MPATVDLVSNILYLVRGSIDVAMGVFKYN